MTTITRDHNGDLVHDSKARDPRWHHVRDAHLVKEPCCRVCGRRNHLNVHHKKPYHLFPELELVDENLITLCEGATGCHLLIGHLGNWEAYNPDVAKDADWLHLKIEHRPAA